mgnify:CR=1 FL=1|jgi:hypothetical protein
MTGLDKLRLSSFILHLFTNQSDNCDYLYFAKESISRCSKLFYIILSKYFYFEPVFLHRIYFVKSGCTSAKY